MYCYGVLSDFEGGRGVRGGSRNPILGRTRKLYYIVMLYMHTFDTHTFEGEGGRAGVQKSFSRIDPIIVLCNGFFKPPNLTSLIQGRSHVLFSGKYTYKDLTLYSYF